eukprot:TRINITY_DN292_c2_g1_i1.p1 TRINITY_DN292_c2_g1~~TRINITY_DN292_c2_g1_i1.p1  ORF type:complete len:275 (-),score=111.22 TRINITY_DN292_c2_g1_i1:84-866(-)
MHTTFSLSLRGSSSLPLASSSSSSLISPATSSSWANLPSSSPAPSLLPLSSSTTIAPTNAIRTKYRYILKRRTVDSDDPRRVPTLRQLLTHLNPPKKVHRSRLPFMMKVRKRRKFANLVDGVHYDAKHIVAMGRAKAIMQEVYQISESGRSGAMAGVSLDGLDQSQVSLLAAKEKKEERKMEREQHKKSIVARRVARREMRAAAAEEALEDEDSFSYSDSYSFDDDEMDAEAGDGGPVEVNLDNLEDVEHDWRKSRVEDI